MRAYPAVMGAPSSKTKFAQPCDREQTIDYLMSEAGTDFYGERIPRWKAEQMVPPPGRAEREDEKQKRELERQRRLSEKFHGQGDLGKAFDRICKAGCDRRWLEDRLLGLARFPFSRDQAILGANTKKQFERIIANLESAAGGIQGLLKMHPDLLPIILAIVKEEEWPAPPSDLPAFLRGIAYCLRESVTKAPGWPEWRRTNAARSRISYLVGEVCRRTGKPHYREMTVLIAAAYAPKKFGEADLKMLVARNRKRGTRK